MIKKVGEGIENGDIIEFNQNSEPLFLYHNGKLTEITPQEFTHITKFLNNERAVELSKFRSGRVEKRISKKE